MLPDRTDLLLAFVSGVPLLSLSVVVAALSMPDGRAVAAITAAVVAHVALAYRRRRPLLSHTVICAAFAAQAATTGLFMIMPSALVFPMSVYAVTAYGVRWAAPVTGTIGAAVVTWRLSMDESVVAARIEPDRVLVPALLLAVVAAAWSMGMFRRTQLAYVAVVEERARLAVLAERTRIAREMHDVIAHSLSVIVSQAKGGRYAPEHAPAALTAIEETGRHALNDVRGLLGLLRSPAPTGPAPALSDLPALIGGVRAAGLDVRHTERGDPRPLSPAAGLAVYRLVQESLTNVVKHAGAGARAAVELDWADDDLRVRISDDGRGVKDPAGGLGLIGMRERLTAVGGSLATGPGPDGGFAVTALIPARTTRIQP
ncbi:histidine kinase [Spongiactinospora sp. TRM90649]|uniref:sensor histidine kinase n=1 Tax=Spongiactinospora sp. TRM90649 TaxID=3031114 RepID=UPI0023F8AE92|nr:histidine kinase [Spongiactinospora sp. TRM90649]MDF5756459.1 histidine kinase [Spongiactinospora sp. TRM90649]